MAGLSNERLAEIVRQKLPGRSMIDMTDDADVTVQADATTAELNESKARVRAFAVSGFAMPEESDPDPTGRMVVVKPDSPEDAFAAGPGPKSVIIAPSGEIDSFQG